MKSATEIGTDVSRNARTVAEALTSQSEPRDLADAIDKISEGMKKLLASGLNKRAIIILLRAETNVGMKDISDVLDGLENLKASYTTK